MQPRYKNYDAIAFTKLLSTFEYKRFITYNLEPSAPCAARLSKGYILDVAVADL